MSAFNSYNAMMGAAQLEADLARFVLPPAAMIGFQFRLAKGDPLSLEAAARRWEETAAGIGRTVAELRRSVSSVPGRDWTAGDRQAYEKKVEEFCAQLEIMQVLCRTVGIALLVFAWALFAHAVFAAGMGTFLAGLAAVAAAAAAGVVTAGVTATCQAIAATCLTVTSVATGVLAAAAQLAAAVFQGGPLAAAVAQRSEGNGQALDDFAQAQVTGSAAALAGLGQNAVNAGLAVRTSPGLAVPGAKTPVPAIDLDADRNANGTWNLGGGATVAAGGMTHTVNGHVKHGDEGFAGGDLSYRGKHSATGLSGGGSLEYTDEDGIGRGRDGAVEYGAGAGWETPGSHTPRPGAQSVPLPNAGVKAGVSGEHDFETGEGRTQGYGGLQVQGGDVYNRTEGAAYGDGPTEYTSKTETPGGTRTARPRTQ